MTNVPDARSKTCTRCGEVKPLEGYHRDNRTADGRRSRCKTCQRSETAANRERKAAYDAEYNASNRERKREQSAAWYAANRERQAQTSAAYRAAKPHMAWESNYRRRSRAYDSTPVVEHFTLEQITARWGDACAHCGGAWTEIDHYPVPVSQGGAHTLENARPSCADCNRESWQVAGDAQHA